MMRKRLSALFRNKTFLIFFSLALAVVCWAAVVLTVSPETTRAINNIPLTMADSSTYAALGLDIIEREEVRVSVSVRGERSVVGALDASSIIVTPDVSSVSAAGVYEVALNAQKADASADFVIESVNPERISLTFDAALSSKFAVTAEISGLTPAEGLVAETAVVSPTEVTVSGPELEVERVASVAAVVEVNATLSESLRRTVTLVARDENGNDITGGSLRIEPATADVTVPILKRGMLQLDIGFTNVPEGFDTSSLRYTLSHTEIPIAAAAATIDNLRTRTVGYIDLTTFDIDETYVFDIQLSSGTVNIDNITQVSVSFSDDNFGSKLVNVTDIRVENAPSNYEVEVLSQQINSVTVIGRSEDVENVLAGSVVAIVDMNTLGGIESGEFNVPVSFVVTSNSTTWVAGVYSVLVQISPA
ncbi:MAG: CdaR family protein [Oscillospiraceae bacterium]|nr:CdaR family protein [Oscillospiraceae bacterium]